MESLLQPIIDQASAIVALFLAGVAAILLEWLRTKLKVEKLTAAEKQLAVRRQIAEVATSQVDEESHRRAKNGSDTLSGDSKEALGVKVYEDVAKDVGLQVGKSVLKKVGGWLIGKTPVGNVASTASSAIRAVLGARR